MPKHQVGQTFTIRKLLYNVYKSKQKKNARVLNEKSQPNSLKRPIACITTSALARFTKDLHENRKLSFLIVLHSLDVVFYTRFRDYFPMILVRLEKFREITFSLRIVGGA